MLPNSQTTRTHPIERFFAVFGAIACLIITILIWLSVSTYQGIWPLPGLYFIELIALGVIGAFAFIRSQAYGTLITWSAAGAFTAFSILGALSVGFFYLPIVLIFTVISVSADIRNRQRIAIHLGVWFIAGVAQAALMLAAIQLLTTGKLL